MLIILADYISWKCIWSMRYVCHLLRHLHGIIGSNVCMAHQPPYSVPAMAHNCLSGRDISVFRTHQGPLWCLVHHHTRLGTRLYSSLVAIWQGAAMVRRSRGSFSHNSF